MYRLIYIMFAALLLACTKDSTELAALDSSLSAIEFTLEENSAVSSIASRVGELKNSWAVGDELAIFIDGVEQSKRYEVTSIKHLPKLAPSVEEDKFYCDNYTNSALTRTYTAYYPYIEGYTVSDYEALESSDQDIISSTQSVAKGVTNVAFETFSRRLCNLSFDIAAGYQYINGIDSVVLSIYDGESLISSYTYEDLGATDATTLSIFTLPISDLSDVVITMSANGDSELYSFAMNNITTITSWEVNTPYHYTDIMIGDLSGSGTESDPWMLYSEQDLMMLQSTTPVSFRNGTLSRDQCFKLGADIALTATAWSPLSTSTPYFSGTFDGDGYVISNLEINTQSNTQYASLFGIVSGATIKNLTVRGSVAGGEYVAGLVSVSEYLSNTTIESCRNECSITITSDYGGGVIAIANGATINQCSNSGSISGSTSASQYIGGVAGSSNGLIINSYNTGDVVGAQYVGGIVGYGNGANAMVNNSYNDGDIKGKSGVYEDFAGIMGGSLYSVSFYNCYNSGVICAGGDETTGNTGAILGSSDAKFGYTGYLESCYTLDNTAAHLVYNSTLNGSVSSSDLKEYATTLNSAAARYNNTILYSDLSTIRACEWATGDGSDGSDGQDFYTGTTSNYYPMLLFNTTAQ